MVAGRAVQLKVLDWRAARGATGHRRQTDSASWLVVAPRCARPPCAKSNCYPEGGFVVPKGVLPNGSCFLC
jgi:hypothetical protein